MTAQKISIARHGGPDVLDCQATDIPEPGPGQLLIRVQAVGVNFIEIYYRTGLYKAPLPHGLGSEGAGEVVAVGDGVTAWKAGDRVAFVSGPMGAYATHYCLPEAHAVRLPDGIDAETAASIMLKGLTVQYLFRQTFPLHGTETVLFHAAAGGVGLLACQWARALGVRLIGTVGSPEKTEIALANGAWQVIDYSREDFVARVRELTDGAGVPVVFDGVGKATWEGSLDCLRFRGLMVSFGNASGPVEPVNLAVLAQKGSLYVTRPTLSNHIGTRQQLEAGTADLFDMVLSGKLVIPAPRKYRLDEAAQAHRDLAARATTGACVLVP
jgi:NADPH2:quinone reductase